MSISAPAPGVAVIGCGRWGQNLVRTFAGAGALIAVHDSDVELAKATADRYDVQTADLDQVLDDPAVDGVVIAASAVAHASLAERVLLAGKDVFVEKPLALVVEEAAAVRDLAVRTDRILMVGHLMQYHPAFLRLKALVGSGDLGSVQYLYSNRLNLGRVRREENALWSFAPHDISMILGLVGSEPTEVAAVGASYLQPGLADVTTTHLAFTGGVRAHVFVSWLHPFKEQKLVVVGDEGMAVLDDGQPWTSKLRVFRHRIDWDDAQPTAVAAESEDIAIEPAEPLAVECQHFLDRIVDRQPALTDGDEGVRVLDVLARAQASMSEARS